MDIKTVCAMAGNPVTKTMSLGTKGIRGAYATVHMPGEAKMRVKFRYRKATIKIPASLTSKVGDGERWPIFFSTGKGGEQLICFIEFIRCGGGGSFTLYSRK